MYCNRVAVVAVRRIFAAAGPEKRPNIAAEVAVEYDAWLTGAMRRKWPLDPSPLLKVTSELSASLPSASLKISIR